jgi:uncharacterized damage-inducible protein DinB
MNTKVCLKARLALVRVDLDEALDRVQDELLSWAPAPGMRTVGGQIAEIGGTEIQVLAVLQTGVAPTWQESEEFSGNGNSVIELRGWLNQIRSDTIAYLESLTEDELNQPISTFKRWFEGLRLEEVPLAEIFRSIAQHESYHTGQLVSYLWASGDNPYKWKGP